MSRADLVQLLALAEQAGLYGLLRRHGHGLEPGRDERGAEGRPPGRPERLCTRTALCELGLVGHTLTPKNTRTEYLPDAGPLHHNLRQCRACYVQTVSAAEN